MTQTLHYTSRFFKMNAAFYIKENHMIVGTFNRITSWMCFIQMNIVKLQCRHTTKYKYLYDAGFCNYFLFLIL